MKKYQTVVISSIKNIIKDNWYKFTVGHELFKVIEQAFDEYLMESMLPDSEKIVIFKRLGDFFIKESKKI